MLDVANRRNPAPVRRRGRAPLAPRANAPRSSRSQAIVVATVALLAIVAIAVWQAAYPPATAQGMVVGDSVVAIAGNSHKHPHIRFFGYPGKAPTVYGGAKADRVDDNWSAGGNPRTIVLNWNGNNPGHLLGTKLVAAYRAELTADIHWYLRHRVKKIILAAAVPSMFNDGKRFTNPTSADSKESGAMLGSPYLNAMYKEMAGQFPGKVFYSEAAARSIHPSMTFGATLNGRECIVDYIHPSDYCAGVYAQALTRLAKSGD